MSQQLQLLVVNVANSSRYISFIVGSIMRTSFFTGFKNKFWKGATSIEVFKFAFYLIVPLGASFIYANPKVMKELIVSLNYVEYPKASNSEPWAVNGAKKREA